MRSFAAKSRYLIEVDPLYREAPLYTEPLPISPRELRRHLVREWMHIGDRVRLERDIREESQRTRLSVAEREWTHRARSDTEVIPESIRAREGETSISEGVPKHLQINVPRVETDDERHLL